MLSHEYHCINMQKRSSFPYIYATEYRIRNLVCPTINNPISETKSGIRTICRKGVANSVNYWTAERKGVLLQTNHKLIRMIQSMTGYGKAVATFGNKKIHVEIKSLNSKAMDLSTRIAPIYREKEMEIRAYVTQLLERGKVDLNIWIEKEAEENATTINTALVKNYHEQLLAICGELGLETQNEYWMPTLLRMPDVLTKAEIQTLDEEEWKTAKTTLITAVAQLIAFRQQEGKALSQKFRENINTISSLLTHLEQYEEERIEKVRERIAEALEKVVEKDYDKNRFEQELIYYIEKLDINEEKQRLRNHLQYFLETLAEGKGQGKKLGFIAQEMGREINTTGSKSNHAEMQKIVVQMKDALEQIKEQVLNVM